jgi:hypothetical protein
MHAIQFANVSIQFGPKNQGALLFILIFLLSFSFLLPVFPEVPSAIASISSNAKIPSSGNILYPLSSSSTLMGIGHPSWAFDQFGNPVDLQALVNLAAGAGANCWREAMYISSSVSQYYFQLKSCCDDRGLDFIIQTLASSVGAMTPQEELAIINNENGKQDLWINNWGSVIQQLNPHAIMVMNEPSNGGSYSTASFSEFSNYRQFCTNCINAWRLIKPDLLILVQNYPFNDYFDSTSYGFASNPLPFLNVIYTRHEYYAYNNIYPPGYKPELQAYWNAITSQDLESAKQLLKNHLLYESLCLTGKGQKVAWDEWGANIEAPHAAEYVKDFLNICKELNIGAVYYDIVPFGYVSGKEPTGLLNNDYRTFNSVGQVWATNIG